jgi:NitT/TauT family transport system ATP-binding protein
MERATPATRLLDVERITKRFVTADGALTAVADVSFGVAPGEFVSIIGPSGCGKSTLFNIIGGLAGDYEGRVTVGDTVVTGPHEAIGMVFQEESTFPWRTVRTSHSRRRRRAPSGTTAPGISSRLSVLPASKGAIRRSYRAACASARNRALASNPRILLMTAIASLDEQTRMLLGDKVLMIQQTLQQTTLLITHNLTEAVQLSDRVIVMTYRPGRVKRIVDIDLPHPRDAGVVGGDRFGRYVAEIWQDLREEATRGIEDSEAQARAGHAR